MPKYLFDYFYESEANHFSYYVIPKELIQNEFFAELSLAAKCIYALLLDRMSLSIKNGYVDKDKKVFIVYQVKDLMEHTQLSNKTVVKFLTELEDFGLIEKRRQGLSKPNLIYIRNFWKHNKK